MYIADRFLPTFETFVRLLFAGRLPLLALRDKLFFKTRRQLSGRSGSGRAAEFAASVENDPQRTWTGRTTKEVCLLAKYVGRLDFSEMPR
jgi:hypothetical protein